MFQPRPRFFAIATLAAATLSACDSATTSPGLRPSSPLASVSSTGNGAPSGAHYNLNIIGVAKGKSPDHGGNGGHESSSSWWPTRSISPKAPTRSSMPMARRKAAFQLPESRQRHRRPCVLGVGARIGQARQESASMTTCFTEFETAYDVVQ